MNKKGTTQKILLYIFYILIAIIILGSLTAYLKDYLNQAMFNKEFLVKDLGLTIDVVSFSPSKINADYNLSNEYSIEIKNSLISIKTKDIEVPEKYELISNIDDFSKRADNIKIKKDNKISIG